MKRDTLSHSEFLMGGGETGELMRSTDWSKTPIGDPGAWPQSLRTAISILLHTPAPMYLSWGEEYTQFYNDAWFPFFGSDQHLKSIGCSTRDTYTGIWNTIGPLFEKMRSGKAVQIEQAFIPDGSAFSDEGQHSFSYSPVYDETGGVGGILVTVTRNNITVNKLGTMQSAEMLIAANLELVSRLEELRQSEERYHNMINEVKDYAILLMDTDGTILNWNKGAEEIKGYRSDEIIGKNFRIFYPASDQQSKLPEKLIAEAASMGKATHEGWRVRKDGNMFWGNIVITALHNENNEIIGFSKVTRDLTERKLAEDRLRVYATQLEHKNNELERSNNELSSFSYVASHDLQEPLRKIQAFGNLILEHDAQMISDTGKDYFNRMIKAAARMQSLIDSLLEFSRITTTQKEFEQTDLNELLQDVLKEMRERIKDTHTTVTASRLPVVPVIPFQFKQLLSNLISNSIKYSKEGVDPVIEITAKLLPEGTLTINEAQAGMPYLEFSVCDNGIGFELEHAEKVFELFQRLHGKNEYSGSGIGLAICKKIAENHGGFMTAEGKPGKGANFQFYMPVSPGTPTTN
jgi:PAS domain S-box-containing protein